MTQFQPGDIISYIEMCQDEGTSLQRGMNFRLRGGLSVILMSLRPGAPYTDRIEEGGKILIYEGHDTSRTAQCPNPKDVDQPETFGKRSLTQNGLFWQAVIKYKQEQWPAEQVRVYEKIKTGIWAYAGLFELIDGRKVQQGGRRVFKFTLRICDQNLIRSTEDSDEIEHTRLIPTAVKLEVWKRDKERCVLCGNTENLHFDHILPFSKGGTSLLAANIQLLCAKHNIKKKDKIE